MTTANYAERFNAAMDAIDPQDSVNRIKNAVIDELNALDPRAHLVKTDYFNHTYAPDLVASWNEGDTENFERYIYIRSDANTNHLLEDIGFVQENKPIVFTLFFDSWQRPTSDLTAELANTSRDSDTLVTDVSGVAELIEHQSSPFLRLVSSSLAKGGRGLMDQTRAVNTSRILKNGFDGALNLEHNSTEEAIDVINSYLNRDYSRKVQQLLQAVWVGAGGGLTEFPGDRDLAGTVSDDALHFLLTYDEIEDSKFWRRVGQNLSLNQVGRLDLANGTVNLDHLMRHNIDTFWSRSARVTIYDPEKREHSDRKWFTRSRLVGYRQHRFDAVFAEKVDELGRAASDEPGVSATELKSRAGDVIVDQVDLTSGGRQVRYSSDSGANILEDDSLENIANTLGEDAIIRRANVLIDDTHHVSCNFSTLTAAGLTSSKIQLGLLARKCLPLIVNVRHDEKQKIEEMFELPEAPAEEE